MKMQTSSTSVVKTRVKGSLSPSPRTWTCGTEGFRTFKRVVKYVVEKLDGEGVKAIYD
jgi:hypothetical protein